METILIYLQFLCSFPTQPMLQRVHAIAIPFYIIYILLFYEFRLYGIYIVILTPMEHKSMKLKKKVCGSVLGVLLYFLFLNW